MCLVPGLILGMRLKLLWLWQLACTYSGMSRKKKTSFQEVLLSNHIYNHIYNHCVEKPLDWHQPTYQWWDTTWWMYTQENFGTLARMPILMWGFSPQCSQQLLQKSVCHVQEAWRWKEKNAWPVCTWNRTWRLHPTYTFNLRWYGKRSTNLLNMLGQLAVSEMHSSLMGWSWCKLSVAFLQSCVSEWADPQCTNKPLMTVHYYP